MGNMNYKQFTLDPFQIESIGAINRGNSVVVSAATGTGKTLIADYVIDKFVNLGYKIIYTAPIKALSNQKFKEFKASIGEGRVGIMTGDVVINPRAQLLIMTTEIYRNMLLARDPIIEDLRYVIFDEIHYLSDIERGTIWEESIIFSPSHIRFLCLSATIPNAKEFAQWIEGIKKHRVEVVAFEQRAVPLQHLLYDAQLGVCKPEQLVPLLKATGFAMPSRRGARHAHDAMLPDHADVVREIHDKLPAIYFLFSRKDCEKKAAELARRMTFYDHKMQGLVRVQTAKLAPEVKRLQSTQNLIAVVHRGIAYHHAGLLPPLKEMVENLFEVGCIKVLYATETFAVGINMPAKTVCFNSLYKYDGIANRPLNSKEYFQLAGRAGRRGIDTVGYAVTAVNRREFDMEHYLKISSKDTEPIRSQFTLSINTVINLINNHSAEEIERILKSNFDYFVRRMQQEHVRIRASFNHKVDLLTKMGYVQKGFLTEKGLFAAHIYQNELEFSEIFATQLYKSLSIVDINILVAAIIYEERRLDFFSWKGSDKTYAFLLSVLAKNEYVMKNINKKHLRRMINIVASWTSGCTFVELMGMCSLAEGDLIRLFRRIIDVLRQLTHATTDQKLADTLAQCIHAIDRDLIEVKL